MDKITRRPSASAREDRMDALQVLSQCGHAFCKHWKWFLLSVIVCLALGQYYIMRHPRIYSQQTTILIGGGDEKPSFYRRNSATSAMKELAGVETNNNIKDEMYILKTRRLMERVVDSLRLDVMYETRRGLEPVTLYKHTPFVAEFPDAFTQPVQFQATLQPGGKVRVDKFIVQGEEVAYSALLPSGQMVRTPAGRLRLTLTADAGEFENQPVKVTRISREKATTYFGERLKVSEYNKDADLIILTCADYNRARANAILNTLLAVYKADIVDMKNQTAGSTADFLDRRIAIVGAELAEVENQLTAYKQANNIVDFSLNAQNFLTQSTATQRELNEVQVQASIAQSLLDYIQENHSSETPLPDLGLLSNVGLQSQIARYNEAVLNYKRLLGNSSPASSVIADQAEAIETMRSAILASLASYNQQMKLRLNQAGSVANLYRSQVSAIPQKELQALDLTRQQGIKAALYTYLLNKREETALQLSITQANVRVVEDPYGPEKPISPRKHGVWLLAFVIGLAIPAVVLWLVIRFNTRIRSRADVEEVLSAPILCEIPHWRATNNPDKTLTPADGNKPIAEAFRILRYSLNFTLRDGGVLMTTSTTPHHGKSFIARNLAIVLAMANKRVVLIDADIRKKTLSIVGNTSDDIGLTSYLSGQVADVADIIATNHWPGVDFIPAGIQPPNPAELLMHDELERLTQALRRQYDYVIFDSTPAFSVADAGILNRVADLTLYVMRLGEEDRRFLRQLERINQSGQFKGLNVILNDTPEAGSSGGYGYGYGYGNEEEKAKGVLARLRARFRK